MAAGGEGPVALARRGVGAVGREDHPADRDPGSTRTAPMRPEGRDVTGLDVEKVVGFLGFVDVADEEMEAVLGRPAHRVQGSGAVPQPLAQARA